MKIEVMKEIISEIVAVIKIVNGGKMKMFDVVKPISFSLCEFQTLP